MALMPKRVKHRKFHRGNMTGKATSGNYVAFGEYGIQSLETGRITSSQIEAARIAANRAIGGQGKIWIRVFPHKSATARPAETRMGKGKGEVDYWFAAVKPGTVLFEIGGVSEDMAREAFRRQAYKLPVKTTFAQRRHSL
ncbi:MAG: 50S ribosomal protein L16 [Planctomycetes bacterium]|nr:50S ribosomal protein L16 [Planctomycetota bacterium]